METSSDFRFSDFSDLLVFLHVYCKASLFPCLPVQESAVTVCVTRSTVLMVASAFRIALTATSACAHSGSEELSVKSVSQCLSLIYKNAFKLLTDGKECDED